MRACLLILVACSGGGAKPAVPPPSPSPVVTPAQPPVDAAMADAAREVCQIDRGCPALPADALPKCPAGKPKAVPGHVIVEGHAHATPGPCLMNACAGRCCRTCSWYLGLTDAQGASTLLVDDGGHYLSCSGDATLQCCPWPSDATVRVTGRPVSANQPAQLTLVSACRP